MKPKKRRLLLGCLAIVLTGMALLAVFENAMENLWLIYTELGVYFIPEESSIFTFVSTEMNHGNGGNWIYGHDRKRYYCYLRGERNLTGGLADQAGPESHLCASVVRSRAEEIEGFDPHDVTTWELGIRRAQ